ncbi:MAG: hypothetical protein NTX50_02310, partial [Candidatus Sumerlaeota bacterium]|nr:hypothetical protein [Candidatus Sumerlaeota bacterium]
MPDIPVSFQDHAERTSRWNAALLAYVLLTLTLIIGLIAPYTNNYDDVKTVALFMLLPWGWVGFFLVLYRGESAPIPKWLWIPLLGFGAVSVVSALAAFKPWRAWYNNGWWFGATAAFIVLVSCIKNVKAFHRVVIAYVCVGLAVILYGFFHYFGGLHLICDFLYPPKTYSGRDCFGDLLLSLEQCHTMCSTIRCKWCLDAFLLVIFPLSLNLLWAPSNDRLALVLGIVTAPLSGAVIVLTHAWNQICALLLIMVLYITLASLMKCGHAGRIKKQRIAFMSGLAIFIVIFAIYAGKPEYFSYNLDWMTQVRGRLNKCALDIFHGEPSAIDGTHPHFLAPLIGAGPGNYMIWSPFYFSDSMFEHDDGLVNPSSWNIYLDILCERGLVGLLCYLWFLAAVIGMGLRQIFPRGIKNLGAES